MKKVLSILMIILIIISLIPATIINALLAEGDVLWHKNFPAVRSGETVFSITPEVLA